MKTGDFVRVAGCVLMAMGSLWCARPAVAPTPANKEPAVPSKLLQDLSLLANAREADAATIEQWQTRIAAGKASIADYVDALLQQPEFARQVGAGLVVRFESEADTQRAGLELKTDLKTPGGEVIYYRATACAPRDAVKVKPWWAPSQEVWICKDDYRPDVFVDANDMACSGNNVHTMIRLGQVNRTRCGCGPSLIRCFPPGKLDELANSMADEVIRTAAYAIDHELPVSSIFTSRESFRDRNVEFLYQRARVESREIAELPDLSQWPADGQWATRPEAIPGEQAGIITSPTLLLIDEGIRQLTRDTFDLMWCVEPSSAFVDSNTVLGLHTPDLRAGGGWKELAGRPICNDCHARMDYGMQFFTGYPDNRTATHFDAKRQRTGMGELYGNGIRDFRGTAPLNPNAFVSWVASQPEFSSCMVQNVVSHVFAGSATPEEKHELGEIFARSGRLRPVMRQALLQYAKRFTATPTPLPELTAHAAAPGGAVRLSPAGRELVELNCTGCHQNDEDFLKEELDPTFARRMLTFTAFRVMPKGKAQMSPADRERLVRELVAASWSEPSERAEAQLFYEGRMQPLRITNHEATMRIERWRVGQTKAAEPVPETRDAEVNVLTPGILHKVASDALTLCKAKGGSSAEIDACLDRALAPESFTAAFP